MVVNRIITDVDDGSAIEDDHKFTRWKDGDPEPYETAWARIRAAAQAGRLGPPTWNNTTRMLSFPVVGGSPVEIEIPGGTVDISGKLNVNLQNVDTTLSAIEKNFSACTPIRWITGLLGWRQDYRRRSRRPSAER